MWEFKITASCDEEEMKTLGNSGWENYFITVNSYGEVSCMYWRRQKKYPNNILD